MSITPKKISGDSLDISAENRKQLKNLFPSVFTETLNDKGTLVESVDFEKLKAELGTFTDFFEDRRERYGMEWPGKKDALHLIQTPIAATLKPSRDESIHFDTTENLFIEGDNLEVLKLLQKSYYGQVKMIYIDPPYNTGNDFIYTDNFTDSLEAYLKYAVLVDGNGKKYSTNTANEGRFHTKWLNMMYPRLYLARNLLRDDGVIFISIGAEELHNLINLMNEVMGEECFKNIIVIRRGIKNVQAQFETIDSLNHGHEYILFYSKNPAYRFEKYYIPASFDEIDEIEGSWNNHWRGTERPTMQYEIFGIKPKNGQWRWSEARSRTAINNWRILCKNIGENSSQNEIDQYVSNEEKKLNGAKFDLLRLSSTGKPEHYIRSSEGRLASDLWIDLKPNGSSQLKKIFDGKYFDMPKSVDLISRIIKISCGENDIIMDFFAGSATTAQAVLELNEQDNGNRKFILIQLPEPCAPDSEAFKAGYKTIADIGKERIRRVIKKLDEEDVKDNKPIDRGFKVFKLDRSNFKQWQKLGSDADTEMVEKQLEMHIDHINHKATTEDLLYEILLKEGLTLTEKIEPKVVAGKKLFSIVDGKYLIYLGDTINKEFLEAIVAMGPELFICLDSAFGNDDQLKANAVLAFSAMNSEKHVKTNFKTI